jgi:predicted transposase/invertase (TIGR01784 family)
MQVSAFNDQELAAYNHSWDEWRTTSILFKGSREEGKAEGKLEIAKSLKSQGIATAVITTATGLTAAEIEKL